MRLIETAVFLIYFGLISCSSEDVDEVAEFERFRKEGNAILVLFTKKCCTCIECVEAEARLGGMSPNLESMNILVVRLRKSFYRKVYGVKTLPSVVFIREGIPALYDGKLEVERLFWWLHDNIKPTTRRLDDESFEHLTQAASGATTGDWLVAFYHKSCVDENALYTHLECVKSHTRDYLNMAIVDISKSPDAKARFKIKQCPEVILFKQGKMYKTVWSNCGTLRLFVEKLHQEYKAEIVPVSLSAFDKLVDNCVIVLKQRTPIVLGTLTLIFAGLALFVAVVQKKPKPKSS